jgi:hypothetical protein
LAWFLFEGLRLKGVMDEAEFFELASEKETKIMLLDALIEASEIAERTQKYRSFFKKRLGDDAHDSSVSEEEIPRFFEIYKNLDEHDIKKAYQKAVMRAKKGINDAIQKNSERIKAFACYGYVDAVAAKNSAAELSREIFAQIDKLYDLYKQEIEKLGDLKNRAHKGGNKSAQNRQDALAERDRTIKAQYETLIKQGKSREATGILARRHDLSQRQIRNITEQKKGK